MRGNTLIVRLTGLVGAALLVGVLPAGAGDAEIQRRVESRLEKGKLTQDGEIAVAVRDGAVTLDGAVATLAARRSAERSALKEAKLVENRLRVLPEPRSDAEIEKDVRSQILRYPFYTIFDSVELGVDEGVVTLRGSVQRPNRKADLESAVAQVAGVREIRNQIAVQPVSVFDDRLRYELARKIYGSEQFVRYANQVNPPIRIIVDRGRITLTGYVATRVDRALLDAIARQTLAFDVANQIKVDGEQPKEEDRRKDDSSI